MKAVLEEIWDSLLELESSNQMADAEIANLTQEFNNIVEKANQGETVIEEDDANNSLAIYENRLELNVFVGELESFNQVYQECVDAKNNIKSMAWGIAIASIITLPLLVLILPYGVGASVFGTVAGSLCNIVWKRKKIKEWIAAIHNYNNINDDIQDQSKKKRICQKLLELSTKAREFAESKKKNAKKLEELNELFVKTLEQEMEEKYREAGIDESIEIESATITANSVNMLSLHLRGEKEEKQG